MVGSASDAPVPDRVPDELKERYENDARKTVHKEASFLYRLRQRVRDSLADADVWIDAVAIFLRTVMAIAIVGGIAYALMLSPMVSLLVVLPIVVVFSFSLLIALRRKRGNSRA